MNSTTNRRRIAFHGSYFVRNFGDTLLVRTMCNWLSEAVGRDNVYLAVPGHAEEQREIGYPVASPRIRHTVTHLIFAGGGYLGEPNIPLHEKYSWYLQNYRRHLSWVSDYSAARKAIFGVGIGPISDPFFRYSVRRLLNGMQSVFVRDDTSLEYARKYRLNAGRARLGIDLAMSIEPAKHLPRHAFGIHVTSMPEPVLAQVVEVLLSQPPNHSRSSPSIMLIADSAVSPRSLRRYEELAKRVGCPLNSPKYNGVDDLMERIADCETIITSKLHVGIVASALGRKVISLPVHPKTSRFYKDLSLQEFCLEGERQRPTEIARLLNKDTEFTFDRNRVTTRISEMRHALDMFVDGIGMPW
jgi:exopolysaccharide biosynthesis predicted pyruvyltransferase EpsI